MKTFLCLRWSQISQSSFFFAPSVTSRFRHPEKFYYHGNKWCLFVDKNSMTKMLTRTYSMLWTSKNELFFMKTKTRRTYTTLLMLILHLPLLTYMYVEVCHHFLSFQLLHLFPCPRSLEVMGEVCTHCSLNHCCGGDFCFHLVDDDDCFLMTRLLHLMMLDARLS